MSPPAAAPEPALIVPDPEAWELWGVDLEARGLEPAATPAAAGVLVVPARIPPALLPAVRAAWRELPEPRRLVELPGPPLEGIPAGEALAGAETAPDSRGDDEGGDGEEHDHGDMMEITGEPSADGLVMEPIETELGPLAPGLPGGLLVALELDGDVVSSCRPRPGLELAGGRTGAGPDPLAPAAWAAAIAEARELRDAAPAPGAVRWRRIAAVECERALSHMLWLRRLAGALGWGELGARASAAARALVPAGLALRVAAEAGAGAIGGGSPTLAEPGPAATLSSAARLVERLLDFLGRSRRLAWRTSGRAAVAGELLALHGVGGPTARASGLRTDARLDRPSYTELGFELRTGSGGDARARVLQRVGEASDGVALALAALARAEGGAEANGSSVGKAAVVESARGPVAAAAGAPGEALDLRAPGAAALYAIAGAHVTGLEWSSALIGLASFDLSPWVAT